MRAIICAGLLTISAVSLLGCASGQQYKTVWRDGKVPSKDTVAACAEYGKLSGSYVRNRQPPPPLSSTVIIAPPSVTEYEGEITSCSITRCTVRLRETRSSRLNRQIQETSRDLGDSAFQAGYAIGAAIAQSSAKRKAQDAQKAAFDECIGAAGYKLVRVPINGGASNKKASGQTFFRHVPNLKTGMTRQQVTNLLGVNPVSSGSTSYGIEEHYCVTGKSRDVFLAVRFIDNSFVAKHIYSVGIDDVKGQTGHCSKFVKLGSYTPFALSSSVNVAAETDAAPNIDLGWDADLDGSTGMYTFTSSYHKKLHCKIYMNDEILVDDFTLQPGETIRRYVEETKKPDDFSPVCNYSEGDITVQPRPNSNILLKNVSSKHYYCRVNVEGDPSRDFYLGPDMSFLVEREGRRWQWECTDNNKKNSGYTGDLPEI